MDPVANMKEQMEIADKIISETDRLNDDSGHIPQEFYDDGSVDNIMDMAEQLAHLVTAHDEWRRKGGWDLYANTMK